MSEYWLSLGTALWLGVLTSISPCPLATNIAAISFVSKRLNQPRYVFLSGILYTAGRAALYAALGTLLLLSLAAVPPVSHFLQKQINQLLGPLLIIIGMVVLDLLTIPLPSWGAGKGFKAPHGRTGVWSSFWLGAVFALSFCPVSAGLFFGGLLPIAARLNSPLVMPIIYGAGTALPVAVFACAIAGGAKSLNALFGAASKLDIWARRITGIIFIAAGIYLSLEYIFGISLRIGS